LLDNFYDDSVCYSTSVHCVSNCIAVPFQSNVLVLTVIMQTILSAAKVERWCNVLLNFWCKNLFTLISLSIPFHRIHLLLTGMPTIVSYAVQVATIFDRCSVCG